MRILFYLSRYPGYGGIEGVTTCLANWFVGYVEHVFIYSFDSQDKLGLLSKLDKYVNYYEASEKGNFISKRNMLQLKSILIEERVNIIIYQDSYAPIEDLLLEAIEGLDIKLWVVEHNTPDYALKAFRFARVDNKWHKIRRRLFYPLYLYRIECFIKNRHSVLYDKSDKYILLSKRFIPVFRQFVPNAEKPKLFYINNPITLPRGIDCFKKKKICLYSGRLETQKGINYLLEIWKEIEKRKKDWILMIVGDGTEREYVKQYIDFYNLHQIQMEGYQTDVLKYYNEAKILCMTSIYEGWPLSLGEAMTNGCVPILFNSYAAAEEIVINGETGFLIKPFNVESYVKHLLFMMDNPSILEQMRKAVIKSSEKFTIKSIGEQWLSCLNINTIFNSDENYSY